MLNNIWELKVQLIPIILAFLIFEIPTLIQRLKKLCYVPIYFSVFPFTQLNYNLSTYLAEDYSGEDLSDPEAEEFRKKLIRCHCDNNNSLIYWISGSILPHRNNFITLLNDIRGI